MKRSYIVLAVLAMAALAGCQINEINEDVYVPEKGEIAFRLADNATKSSSASATVNGAVIPIKSQDGTQLYLEETITRLDDISYEPMTKGTPAYTENFLELYHDFKAAAYKKDGNSYASLSFDDGVFEQWRDQKIWKRRLGDLTKADFPLYFFLRAPYDQEGSTVTNLSYYPNGGTVGEDAKPVPAGGITFTYDGSSLTSATDQKDLLFTSREVTAAEYDDFTNKNQAIPVLFHHALTGVKFANFFSNPDEDLDVKTYITKVEITGLADGGRCIIKPRQEGGKYEDDKTGDYSSATVASWDMYTYGEDVVYTQTFGESDEIDYPVEGDFGKKETETYKGTYTGTTWGSAGNKNNLNKADGSLTFWFVPQQLTADVEMTVYYKVYNTKNPDETYEGYEDHDTIKFGDLTRKKTETTTTEGEATVEYGDYATWKAGELRTYTLKPRYVDVELVDDMTDYVKSNVVVTNNGNVWEYVRVNLIGNWVGNVQIGDNEWAEDEGTILFGFAAATGDTRVKAWNDKDGLTSYGTFTNLVPKSDSIIPRDDASEAAAVDAGTILNNWVRYDKYYYYIHPIGPNESVSDQLFESYEVGVSPEFWIPDKWGVRRKAGDVHLIMDVIVQAIPAETDINGNITDNYIDAWVRELGKNSPDDLLDL